jgi:hypothetical protein
MSNHSKIKNKLYNIHPKNILKNRYALSTVVTTLIILVISVLLASVVTYFAINVVSTRVQEESLALTKQHIWHNSTSVAGAMSYSQAAVMVINTGGRDVVIQKLSVRGQNCEWNSTTSSWNNPTTPGNQKTIFYCTTTDPIAQDLPYVSNFNVSAANKLSFGTKQQTFTQASTSLVLKSGYTMIIYIVNPDSITINDIGLTVSVTLYTAQAMYYVETNVQAVDLGST